MIRTVTVENEYGLSVSTKFVNTYESPYVITNMTGYGPVNAEVNLTQFAVNDGAIKNSSRVGERVLSLTLVVVRGAFDSIEAARQYIYRVFPNQARANIVIESDTGLYTTSGTIEKCEPDVFSQQESIVVSIVCEDPYFYTAFDTVTDFSSVQGNFQFPFHNDWDASTYLWPYSDDSVEGWDYRPSDSNYDSWEVSRVYTDLMTTPWQFYLVRHPAGSIHRTQKSRHSADDEESARLWGWTEESAVTGYDGHYQIDSPWRESEAPDKNPHLTFGEMQSHAERVINYPGVYENGIVIRTWLYGRPEVVPGLRYYDSANQFGSLTIDMAMVKKILGEDFSYGDMIEINTKIGNKGAWITHNGKRQRILNALGKNPYWPKLVQGENRIGCTVTGSGADQFAVKHEIIYDVKVQGF